MKKFLAIDYGIKNIGLALGNDEQKIALPYEIIKNKSVDFVLEEIENICQQEGINKVVIGLPLSMNGRRTSLTQKVEDFIHLLANKTDLAIDTVDERFTTKEIEKKFRQVNFKSKKDAAAAALILEGYLDRL